MNIYCFNFLPKNHNYILINYRDKKSDGYHYGFGSINTSIKNGYGGYIYAKENYSSVKIINISMGNAIFGEILKENVASPGSIISISGLYNLHDILDSYIPYISHVLFPNRFYTVNNYSKNLNCPYTIVHGDMDQLIPFRFATQMYDKLKKENKDVKLIVIKGYDHNDIDFTKYIK